MALLAGLQFGAAPAAAEKGEMAESPGIARIDRDGDGRGDVCTLMFRDEETDSAADAIVGGIWFARPPNGQASIFLAVRISAFGVKDGSAGYLALNDAWLRAGSFDSRDMAFVKDVEAMNLAKMQTGAVRLRSVDQGLIERFLASLETEALILSAQTDDGRMLTLALRPLDQQGRDDLGACLADIRTPEAP